MREGFDGFVIAFDFGLKHIGVAIGQTVTGNARGLTTLSASNGAPDWRVLASLCNDYKPTQVVVGMPLNMDGSHSDMASLARIFAEQITQRTHLDTAMHDERLTSSSAKTELEAAKAMGKAKTEHELAACLILESWLSENCSSTK